MSISLAAVLAILIAPQLTAQCSINNECPTVVGPVGAHFRGYTPISVYMDPAFTTEQRQVIQDAFNAWQYHPGNTTGMTYTFQVGNAPAGDGVFNILREEPQSTKAGDAGMGEVSIDEFTNSGFMRLAPGLTSLTGLRNIVAHEIGHALGLDDCEACCPGTTVMAGVPNLLDINKSAEQGSPGPTECDVKQASERVKADLPKSEIGGIPLDKRDAESVSPEQTCYDWYLITWIDTEQYGRIYLSVEYLGRSCS
ncbi:MAG TPA: hypothetical protein VE010_06810 [Thermoanaerobaculia bacterium]|nr:hypothetical protein [Thermoanaerobaculia bacterium]